jgi:hypothetical protein
MGKVLKELFPSYVTPSPVGTDSAPLFVCAIGLAISCTKLSAGEICYAKSVYPRIVVLLVVLTAVWR